jgi:hypothetical protein
MNKEVEGYLISADQKAIVLRYAHQCNIKKDQLKELIQEYGHGKFLIEDMTNAEASALISHLTDLRNTMNQMRKKLLSHGYTIAYDVARTAEQWDRLGGNKSKINHENVDAWCRSKKGGGKGMNRLNYKELDQVLKRFWKVRASYINEQAKKDSTITTHADLTNTHN